MDDYFTTVEKRLRRWDETEEAKKQDDIEKEIKEDLWRTK